MKKLHGRQSGQERPEEPKMDGATEETDEEKEETNMNNGGKGNPDPGRGSRDAGAGAGAGGGKDDPPSGRSKAGGHAVTFVGIAVGAGGALVSAPLVLGTVGFTSAGIAAGSYAAVLQSAGMAGLSTAATGTVAGIGGIVVGLLAALI
ncbi:hypothetical protein Q5P01_020455 [Channa striata]|uniref:Uncharacterized protein n=1 Tax=Channa striata TaxID=64152 RepID=A0AA88SBC9_CHASR|nr:hypothetical protein Q5P01_020455 [Channa striata]